MPDVKDAYFSGLWNEDEQKDAQDILEEVVSTEYVNRFIFLF